MEYHYQIREMNPEDLTHVCLIEAQSFDDGDLASNLYYYSKRAYHLVAFEDKSNQVIGYIQTIYDNVLKPNKVETRINISTIAIAEQYRKKGIATALIQAIITMIQTDAITDNQYVSALTLQVRISNRSAIALYDKLNFIKDPNLLKNYYHSPEEDGHYMVRTLT
jgi:ribosomal-protein-alanine N-acetyltransferase